MKISRIILNSIISAVFLILTLPPFNIAICSWFALVPLLIVVFREKEIPFYWIIIGFLITGLISNLYAFSWIISYQKITYLKVLPLCILIFPIFGFLMYIMSRWIKNMLFQFLLAPTLWVILLKIYSFTYIGYHWGEQFWAYSQNNLLLIQIVSIFGTLGLSYLILLFNSAVSLFVIHRNFKSILILIFTVLLVFAALIYGDKELKKGKASEEYVKTLKISLVQPGLSGEPGFEDATPLMSDSQFLTCIKRRAELPQFITLNRAAAKEMPDLIVWPQYNLPIDLTKRSRVINQFYTRFDTPILIGTFRYVDRKLANISLLLNHFGKAGGIRTSVRPPPFRQMNQAFGREFKPIEFRSPNTGVDFKIGALLCYEDVSSESSMEIVKNGAEILLVHVNNEVFQNTILPPMHSRRDIFRAIELRKWFVRAATTGVSAIIDPQGRKLQTIGMGEKEIIYANVEADKRVTFYARNKDLVTIISILFIPFSYLTKKIHMVYK